MKYNIVEIIEKKIYNKKLKEDEINYFVKNYTDGNIKDYQAASLITAIMINGLDIDETYFLTKAMINSGKKLNFKRENFYNNLEKGLEILEILKKCYENKFLIFIDNEDFFETKIGIIIELEDEKLKMKEIDKYGNFNKISEVYFDEIQLLAIKNYKFMEEK